MNSNVYKNERIKEELYYKEMDTGLKVYFMPKKGYSKKYAIFATNYGSIDNIFIPSGEDKEFTVPEGIAHFLEHKLFEEPDENIFDKFSKAGAYVNAFTNFNQTAYLFYSTDSFYENLELLVKFVQNPYLTDENVEKEKGIIEQEIKMYEDNANFKVLFNCLKSMYKTHPVRVEIAGTVESINTITKEDLLKSYNTFYHPSNMVLFVAGDLNFDEIIKAVNRSEKKVEKIENNIKRIYPEEPTEVNVKLVEEEMMTSIPLFYMGFKDNSLNLSGKEEVKKDIVTNIVLDMLFGPSSKFYNELYAEGLIDNSFGAYYTGRKTYGHSLMGGGSIEPKKVYERVISLIQEPAERILSEEDFNRIKSKNLGGFLMGLNSIEFIANNFIDLYPMDFLLIDYLDLLEEVSYKDIIDRFNSHFNEKNLVLSIINPPN